MNKDIIHEILTQREEILRAFVAKYGFDPDEAVQVVQMDGPKQLFWVERREKTMNENMSPWLTNYKSVIPTCDDHKLAEEIRTIANAFNLLLAEAKQRNIRVTWKAPQMPTGSKVEIVSIEKTEEL